MADSSPSSSSGEYSSDDQAPVAAAVTTMASTTTSTTKKSKTASPSARKKKSSERSSSSKSKYKQMTTSVSCIDHGEYTFRLQIVGMCVPYEGHLKDLKKKITLSHLFPAHLKTDKSQWELFVYLKYDDCFVRPNKTVMSSLFTRVLPKKNLPPNNQRTVTNKKGRTFSICYWPTKYLESYEKRRRKKAAAVPASTSTGGGAPTTATPQKKKKKKTQQQKSAVDEPTSVLATLDAAVPLTPNGDRAAMRGVVHDSMPANFIEGTGDLIDPLNLVTGAFLSEDEDDDNIAPNGAGTPSPSPVVAAAAAPSGGKKRARSSSADTQPAKKKARLISAPSPPSPLNDDDLSASGGDGPSSDLESSDEDGNEDAMVDRLFGEGPSTAARNNIRSVSSEEEDSSDGPVILPLMNWIYMIAMQEHEGGSEGTEFPPELRAILRQRTDHFRAAPVSFDDAVRLLMNNPTHQHVLQSIRFIFTEKDTEFTSPRHNRTTSASASTAIDGMVEDDDASSCW